MLFGLGGVHALASGIDLAHVGAAFGVPVTGVACKMVDAGSPCCYRSLAANSAWRFANATLKCCDPDVVSISIIQAHAPLCPPGGLRGARAGVALLPGNAKRAWNRLPGRPGLAPGRLWRRLLACGRSRGLGHPRHGVASLWAADPTWRSLRLRRCASLGDECPTYAKHERSPAGWIYRRCVS